MPTIADDLGEALRNTVDEMVRAERIVRTMDFTAQNRSTRYTIVIALGQGLDESPVVDPPNQRDTGVIVFGQNTMPGRTNVTPVQPAINVKSTRVRIAYRWRYNPTGYEADSRMQDMVAPPGYYYLHPMFWIADPASAEFEDLGDGDTPPAPVVTFSLQPIK